MLQLVSKLFSTAAVSKGLRNKTIMGTKFKVYERKISAKMVSDGLAKSHYYLQNE